MLDEFPHPMLFAHRGSCAHAPENTIAAFELAVKQFTTQPAAIELDVKLSADKEVMVIHDASVDRTTDGKGQVNQLTLGQLKQLDAGSFFNPAFRGEKIPTLDDVFEAVGHQAFINIELTNYSSPLDQLPKYVAQVVKRHNLSHSVMFSSFLPFNLPFIRYMLPNAVCGLLLLPGMPGSCPATMVAHEALHPEIRDVTPELVERVHKTGHRVHVWTVNAPADIQRLADWGVDGIFTDDPPGAQQALAALHTQPQE
jgi:glycerophosphoryl diester phosphodiesterase